MAAVAVADAVEDVHDMENDPDIDSMSGKGPLGPLSPLKRI